MAAWGDMVSCGYCPVTGGIPTRMTDESFSRLCREKQRAAKESADDAPYANKSAASVRRKLNGCSACRGKMRPPELEIIKMEEIMGATKKGMCDLCGEAGLLVSSAHHGQLCSTCKTICAHVKNRPATVVSAIKRLNMVDEYLGGLAGEQEVAAVDASVARIVAAVGYEGTAVDELATAVEKMAGFHWLKRKGKNMDKIAATIANSAIAKLREQGLDCVKKGGFHDVSSKINDAIFFSVIDVIKNSKTEIMQ